MSDSGASGHSVGRAELGVSTRVDPAEAGVEAVERAAERLGGTEPGLTVLLATAAHGGGLVDLVAAAREATHAPVVGASVEGILAPEVEVSSWPAAVALAVAGYEAEPFLVADASGSEARAGHEIAARLGEPGDEDLLVLLADSQSVDVNALSQGLPEALDGATVLGAGAAAVPRGRPLLWSGAEHCSDAVSGWILRGARPRVSVAQAGRALTEPLTVTRARGHWVLGIAGRPALDVYEEAMRLAGLDASPESPSPLLVGLLEGEEGGAEEPLARNVVGLDPARRAFSVPEPMYSGRRLVFLALDGEDAREELARRTRGLDSHDPRFGLYLNCRARGQALFGEPGVEVREIANVFASCPLVGVTGPFQLAPLAGGRSPSVLTYAGVLALVS